MKLNCFVSNKQLKIVLGVEIGLDSVALAFVQVGKVNHILLAREEKLPTEAVGNFLVLAQYIKTCVANSPYHFSGLAVATNHVEYKTLPLKNVGDKEIISILEHEMQVSWGLNTDDYQFGWYRKDSQDADLQIGFLPQKELDNYSVLAKGLETELLCVTGVQPVQFNDVLIYNAGYKDDGEKEQLESNFCGAVHAVLVAVQAAADVNFLQRLQMENQRSQYAGYYLIAGKMVGVLTALVLVGTGIFYGVSRYKLYVAKKNLASLQPWCDRYDYCLTMSNKINRLQSEVQGINADYQFRGELVEKILDAMPEFNNEIVSIRTMHGQGAQSGKLIIEGKVQDSKQLRSFVNELKKIEDFQKVDLESSKNSGGNGLEYGLSLLYGKKGL